MPMVELPMPDGETLRFEVRRDPSMPILFALAVRKSGSSVMNNILRDLASANEWPFVSLPEIAFERGYRVRDWQRHPELFKILRRGNLYAGFRDAPISLFNRPIFRDAPKILMVRDPRDALVSEYFSAAYSHSLPKRDADTSPIMQNRQKALASKLEDFVLEHTPHLNRTIDHYAPLIGDTNLRLFRYEDVIFAKRTWIRDMVSHFGWSASDALVERLLLTHDQRPAEERPTEFVRQVTPGDHRNKLSPDAIAKVNAMLSPTWRQLGYDLG